MPPPFALPLPGYRPQGSAWWYGAPRTGHTHAGIDLVAPTGTPVVAAAAGTVTQAGQGSASAGLAVTLAHFGAWSSFYCHLSRIDVTRGQAVAMGEVIGLVGATGNAEGPHLHTELTMAGHDVDPLPLYAWPEHEGAAARWLQRRLKAHGHDPGAIDGKVGRQTIAALAAFQTAHRLDVLRALDPPTYLALRRAPAG